MAAKISDKSKYYLDKDANTLEVEEGQSVMIHCTIMPETKFTIHNTVWRKMNEQGIYTKLPLIHDMREGVDSKGQNIYIHIDGANTIHSGYYSCMSQGNTKLSRNFRLKVKGKRIL